MDTSLAFKELFVLVKLRVGVYSRLSRDEDKSNYSSIIAQKDMAITYVENINKKDDARWEMVAFYEDDNVSGYTFERDGFLELLDALENDKIDVIIAKDLSRIGRHNSKTLLFIEKVKELGKRLILIDEGSGGYDTDKDDDDIIGIKTWYNERYVKDISKKIRSNIKTLQNKGAFLVETKYGYKKDPKNKGQVIIDEVIAPVIVDIFEKFVNGMGCRKLALYLQSKGIPSPGVLAYQRKLEEGKPTKKSSNTKWSQAAVYRIIKDDFYLGVHRCGKRPRNGIHGAAITVSEEKHIVHRNHHQPIIDEDTFNLAQEIIEKRKTTNYRSDGATKTEKNNIFAGFLFCADCGSFMTSVNKSNRSKAYRCGKYHQWGANECSTHYVREDDLLTYFRIILNTMKENLRDMIDSYNKVVFDILTKEKNFDSVISKLEKELEGLNNELKVLVTQKVKAITKDPENEDSISTIYDDLIKENHNRAGVIRMQLKETSSTKENTASFKQRSKNAMDVFNSILEKEEYERRDLEAIIDKILIDSEGNPTIKLKPHLQVFLKADSSLLHTQVGVK